MHTVPTLLDHPAVTRFDNRVDSMFNLLRGRTPPDRLLYGLSEAANHSILWHVLTWQRVLRRKSSAREAALVSIALGIESGLVNGPIKAVFRRERPDFEGERPHALRTPKTSSFPSGHATSAFCAATLLGRGRPRCTQAALFGLAGLVAFSRVHVRIHHASDVLAGTAIGLLLGKLAKRLLRNR